MLKKILHTGLAVPKLPEAIVMYKSLGFTVTKQFHKPDLNADVAMVTKEETTFELFEFHNLDHPQVKFIRNHIAIYSDDIEKDVNNLLGEGYKLVIPINDGMVFRFAFLQDKSGTNYEVATEKN
ncbi:MAG TPA: VOC family protein [Candidatus Saccharimonadales bacterium]|nr:VOC family protein [Candidatus Saccharimonadales bacterium]